MNNAISKDLANRLQVQVPFFDFFSDSEWARHQGEPGNCEFVTGEPQEMALPAFVDALARWSRPADPHWFGYKTSDPAACAKAAEALSRRVGLEFDPSHLFLTNGAIAGLTIALRSVVDPGDEVIYLSPPWFGYEPMIGERKAKGVRVDLQPPVFDLDVAAIEAAITERTRAIIVNSPNNPTGRIYQPAELTELAAVLDRASERNGRPVYIISDEAYSRVLFDGRRFFSPAAFYDRTLLVYTYAKTMLTPGERIGYIALPPGMPDAELVGRAIFVSQFATGWSFPNAVLQHALADLEEVTIDLEAFQHKRDVVVRGLSGMGYEVLTIPEGTFYVLVKSPLADDMEFIDLLAARKVFVLPGSTTELPGFFRISLTASMDMVERSMEGFRTALEQARSLRRHDGG
ncbi:MAG TPA: aminotransferase class I/II-fold pyridoxal phosphate-dependent enzyme [Actinomycetota bacterium]|nr:aminotransferase class I/II-fold pyridoxal phosphate-dependent enzyme [Actinomycetota bacterium]